GARAAGVVSERFTHQLRQGDRVERRKAGYRAGGACGMGAEEARGQHTRSGHDRKLAAATPGQEGPACKGGGDAAVIGIDRSMVLPKGLASAGSLRSSGDPAEVGGRGGDQNN